VTFDVGTRVLYPVHGVADVVGRERRTVDGRTSTYLVLTVEGALRPENLTLLVPEDRLDEIGVRHAVSAEDAVGVLEVLAARDPHVPANWSRRFKNHQEKLRTGDVFAVAEVVRNLSLRRSHKKLGPAESSMYLQARHGLVAELAVSFGISDEDAADRVDHALERTGS
jgi:CarD family transcriptional regulator